MSSVCLSIQEQRVSKRGREGFTLEVQEDSSFEGSEPKIPHFNPISPPAAAQPLNTYHVVSWTNYTGAEVLEDPEEDSDSSAVEDRYLYHDTIGEGAFGEVEKALDTSRNCWVAVKKIFKDPDLDNDPECDAHRESALLKQLRDHHTPHRLNWIDGYDNCVVTDYIPSQNVYDTFLSEESTEAELVFDEIVSIFRQGLEFFSSLRMQGVIHGDPKPENMIYERSCRYLTFLDYGSAILSTDEAWEFCTTPGYRSPEEILRGREGRSNGTEDLWSWACLIYELLTKEQLFNFDEEIPEAEIDISHLDMIHHQIGLPSPVFLSNFKKAEKFYSSDGLPKRLFQEADTPKWDERLRQVAKDKQIPPERMEQMITLLAAMLRYGNRGIPKELLKSPLFQEDVCFHLAEGLPKEGQILIHRISKLFSSTIGAPQPDITIDLSSPVTRTCYHLPRDHRYVVSILKSDQSLISMLEFDIKDGAILDLKPYFTHQ